MLRSLIALAALAFTGLGACAQARPPYTYRFEASPHILRGNWVGSGAMRDEATGSRTVSLSARATYVNELEYRLEGTLEVSGLGTLRLEGSGGPAAGSDRIASQDLVRPAHAYTVSEGLYFNGQATGQGGEGTWSVNGSTGPIMEGSCCPPRYTLELRRVSAPAVSPALSPVPPPDFAATLTPRR